MTTTLAWLLLGASVTWHGHAIPSISPPLPSYKACANLVRKLQHLQAKALSDSGTIDYTGPTKYLCYQTRIVTGK